MACSVSGSPATSTVGSSTPMGEISMLSTATETMMSQVTERPLWEVAVMVASP